MLAIQPETSVAVTALQAYLESSPPVMATLATAALRHAALRATQRRHAVQPRRRLRRLSKASLRPPPGSTLRRVVRACIVLIRTRRRSVSSCRVCVIGAVIRLADEALTAGMQVPSTENQCRRRTLAALVSSDLRPAPHTIKCTYCVKTAAGSNDAKTAHSGSAVRCPAGLRLSPYLGSD